MCSPRLSFIILHKLSECLWQCDCSFWPNFLRESQPLYPMFKISHLFGSIRFFPSFYGTIFKVTSKVAYLLWETMKVFGFECRTPPKHNFLFQQAECLSCRSFQRWLPLRLSKRQSPTTILFRTTLARTITLYELLILLGSNHLLCRSFIFIWDFIGLTIIFCPTLMDNEFRKIKYLLPNSGMCQAWHT